MSVAHTIAHEARLFFVALQFLTRLPVPGRVVRGFELQWLNRCVVHFPLVGALVGAIGAVVLWLASLWWPAWVAALLAVGTTVWVTGAFHEDGLADTFDALGGTVSRERALEIMKDSRIGTYGAVALLLSLALRAALVAALTSVDVRAAAMALVVSHVLGRTAAVGVMAGLPYAGDVAHAKAKPLATTVAWSLAAAAGLGALALIGSLAMLWPGAIHAGRVAAAVGSAIVAGGLAARWLRTRLGGYTGDALGATEQLTEVVALLALSAAP